jgi:hypothetical protein
LKVGFGCGGDRVAGLVLGEGLLVEFFLLGGNPVVPSFQFGHQHFAEGLGLVFAFGFGGGHVQPILGLADFGDGLIDGERDFGQVFGGDLQSVEEQARPSMIDGIGGESGNDAGDGELDGRDVLDVREVDLVTAKEADRRVVAVEFAGGIVSEGLATTMSGFASKGVVVVAPDLAAEGGASAFGSIDANVTAFFHGMTSGRVSPVFLFF